MAGLRLVVEDRMLDEKALDELLDWLNFTAEARQRVRWIRANAPIRAVGGGSKNTVCRFSSKKMGFVLEAEAFNTEYAAFEEYENDESILEYYAQPCKLRIDYRNANDRSVHPDITPDIFKICRSYFAFVECKTEEELLKLAQSQPNRYVVDADGKWRSPPAEFSAKKLGCRFEVRSSSENNWVAIENYEFFCDYLQSDFAALKISPGALSIVEKRLSQSSWLTVRDLIGGAEPVDADSLYSLIVTKKIYFDFLNNRISNPDQALIFRDEISAKTYNVIARIGVGLATPSVTAFEPIPGRRFLWDGKPWQIANVGTTGVSAMPLSSDSPSAIIELHYENLYALAREGKIVPVPEDRNLRAEAANAVFKRMSAKNLQIANWRYQILFTTPDQNNPLTKNRPRSIANWRANYRAAEIEFGCGFIGLFFDRNNKQGNHDPKGDPQAHTLALQAYKDHWETDAQRSAALCHAFYRNKCEEEGVCPLTLKSFRKIISKHRSYEQTKARKGEKAAYDEEPPYLVLEYTVPRHGNRPFNIGHIDHTPLPIKIRDKTGKLTLQTIWLSLLIDAYSRYVLAIYLSFDPPSYRSCMMLIRECVRQHGRIPHWVVVDNGSDFQSVYFETLLGALQSHKKDRPKGKPKFGSVIERIFQTTTDQFISNLLGATHDMNPRQVGHDIDPERKAIWTYEKLWVRLQSYLSNVYHRNVHSTLGQSPEAAFVEGQQTFGLRSHRFFSYTQDFIILTCPSTPKGNAKVTPKGVKINYLYYRCLQMDLPGVLGSRLDVRYDPANFGTAYTYLQGAWRICYSEYFAIFKNYSEKQIRIATNHLRLKSKLLGQHQTINGKNLADFLTSAAAEELLGMQRLVDAESSSVNTAINTPNNAPPEPANDTVPATSPPVRAYIEPTLLEDF